MFDERVNRIVGLVALSLLGAGVTVVLAKGDRPFSRVVHFTVVFDRVGRLRVGAPVRMNNLDMGKVAAITFQPAATGRGPGKVRVLVWIRAKHRPFVRRNSRFVITATSLIGARHVEVLPPAGPPDRPVRTGDVLLGEPPPHLDRMLRVSFENLKTTTDLLAQLEPDIAAFKAQLQRAWRLGGRLRPDLEILLETLRTAERAGSQWKAIAGDLKRATRGGRALSRLSEKWAETSGSLRDRMSRLGKKSRRAQRILAGTKERWAEVRASQHLRHARRALRRAVRLARAVRSHLQAVQRAVDTGLGTVGALMHDRVLWDDFKATQRTLKHRIWTLIGRPKANSPEGYPVP